MSDKPKKIHEFNVRVTWTGGKEGTIAIEDKPDLPLTAPVQWDGKPESYSPHDLFMSAITGCFITTFASIMKQIKQPIRAHQVSGRGILQKHTVGG